MEDFEYAATHKGKECAEYYAAEYMVNCDGLIIGYKLEKDPVWKEANVQKYPGQVFPKVSTLEALK